MRHTPSVEDRTESPVPDRLRAGPVVPRMILGTRLRRLRKAQFITRSEAAEAIRVPDCQIGRMELGRTGMTPRDVADLLTIYGVTDEAERATLLELARLTRTTGWWHAYGDVLPPWLHTFLGAEQAADVIRAYEPQFVPGLLQTRDYARAVVALDPQDTSERQLRRRVELRLRRQRVLHRQHPPHFWVVIDEAALRRPVGGPLTMRAQLRHLLTVAELPHVTLQVMPFRFGGHAAAGCPISLLRLPERELPDLVYVEQLVSGHYPERAEDIDHYRNVIDRLVVSAEPPATSRETLRRVLDET